MEVDVLRGVILPYLNLAIFLGAAFFFLKKPLRDLMRGRFESFQKNVDSASLVKKEAEEKYLETKSKYESLSKTIEDLKNSHREEVEREAEQIKAAATSFASHIREEVQRISRAELVEAKESIRRQIVDEVVQKLSDRVRTDLQQKDHLRLIRSDLSSLPSESLGQGSKAPNHGGQHS